MPLYQTRCPACDKVDSIWRKIADRDDLPVCGCGERVKREIVAPSVQASFPEFISPVSGKLISSRTQHREDLAATNSLPYEPGMKQDIERRRQDLIEADYQKIDKAVDEVVTALNTSGRLDYATD